MHKELIVDLTTGVIVLGSVFGATHLRKLCVIIRGALRRDAQLSIHPAVKKNDSDSSSPPRPNTRAA